MRSINTYISIFKTMGFSYCIREIYRRLLWMGKSRPVIEQQDAERCAKYLYRHYKSLIEKRIDSVSVEKCLPHKDIWVFWAQGLEQAPVIVKKCVESIRKYCDGCAIHIIDENSFPDYVSMPDYILERYHSKSMSCAAFSDILRTALLVKYGGIWVDATVLLTGSLPEVITKSSLFLYQKPLLSNTPHFGSNWLISSEKNNPVLQRQLELLYAYWKDNRTAVNYFIYHVFLYLISVHNCEIKELCGRMPYIDNSCPHLMQFRFSFSYNSELWSYILSQSSVHKLTYKYKDPTPNERTIWSFLLNEYEV
jgi:hypothetical protein